MSSPVIVGIAQYKQSKNAPEPLDPLGLMTKTAQMALDDSGISDPSLIIDAIYMININSWSYQDAPGELAQHLRLTPRKKVYLSDGGNTPQMLLNRAAKHLSQGDIKAVLITGGECAYSLLREKKGEIKLTWPKKRSPNYMEGQIWAGISHFVNKYRLSFPPYTYALFETALRAKEGRSIGEHNHLMGELFEEFSKVAAKNPYAWSQKAYSAEEIITPFSQNRYINHPYTKRMCANKFVDLSASLIMTTDAVANTLNIDKNKQVYLMGGSDLKNIHDITRRPTLYDSPATRIGSKLALEQAGISLHNINCFDIYSCFPSIVEIISHEMGIPDDDSRPLTLTGGLPYFGGPWSNYSMHGAVEAVQYVRDHPSAYVMVVANGGYNTKQSFGIYGRNPPKIPWTERDDSQIQQSILKEILEKPMEMAEGELTVEAYTITYDRKGKPKKGLVFGKLTNGRRTLSLIEGTLEKLSELEKQELVGRSFTVHYDSEMKLNVITLD